MQSDVCQLLQVPSFQRAAHSILEMAGMVDLISTTSPPPRSPFHLLKGYRAVIWLALGGSAALLAPGWESGGI